MKTSKLIALLLLISITSIRCSSDDDPDSNAGNQPTLEVEGRTFLSSSERVLELDLVNGAINKNINQSVFEILKSEHKLYYLDQGVLIKAGAIDENIEWSYIFPSVSGFASRFLDSHLGIIGENIYVSWLSYSTSTYQTTYHITSINTNNGFENWTIDQLDEIKKMSIFNNVIFTLEDHSIGNTKIKTRDKNTGAITNVYNLNGIVSHLIPTTNSMLIMSWSNKIISLSESLSINWVFNTSGGNVMEGKISNGNLIFYSRDDSLYSIDIISGSENWNTYLGEGLEVGLFVVNEEVITVKNTFVSHELNSYSLTNGEQVKSSILEIQPNTEPDDFEVHICEGFILTAETFLDGSTPSSITLRDYVDNSILWRIPTPDSQRVGLKVVQTTSNTYINN